MRVSAGTAPWACLLALWFAVPVAQAQIAAHFDIPAQTLADSLRIVGSETHTDILFDAKLLAGRRAPALEGDLSAGAALSRLLAGTGIEYRYLNETTVVLAPGAYVNARLNGERGDSDEKNSRAGGDHPRRETGQAHRTSATSVKRDPPLAEIIVTAQKMRESIIDVPVSMSVLEGKSLEQMEVHSFVDYATKVPDLSFSYGTGGLGFADSRTIAIRGISGSGTTALYVDDVPIDESMDPRVLDFQRIEVLMGPQGTLFGEDSLGGAVRLVTEQPDLNLNALGYSVSSGMTSHAGSLDYDADLTGNSVIADDRAAIRMTAFVAHEGGFITRTYPLPDGVLRSSDNQGAELSYGGSLSTRVRVSDRFDAVLRLLGQWQDDQGLPDTYAALPEFEPNSLVMNRAVNLQEFAHEHWLLPMLQLDYEGTGWSLVSGTSYVRRDTFQSEDGTEGTADASELYFDYTPQPVSELWMEDLNTRRFSEEMRLAVTGHRYVNGVLGVYFSQLQSGSVIGPYEMPGLASSGLFPTDLGWYSLINNYLADRAEFGQLYISPVKSLTVTLGARQYALRQHYQYFANGIFNGGSSAANTLSRQSGVSPKVAVQYKLDQDASIYTSVAKGFRPGDGTTPLPPFCASALAAIGLTPGSAATYSSDHVWDYEIGSKAWILQRSLLVTDSVYQINWTDIQQPVFLPTCGFTFTTNAGAARSRGAEFELSGRLLRNLTARLGVGYDRAVIAEQGRSTQLPGSPVYEVPKVTATVALAYSWALSESLTGSLSGDFSYVGSSLSAVSSLLSPLVRPAYSVLNLQLGIQRARNELSLYASNATDDRANLGDINPISYVRYVNGQILPRVAVLRPLSIGIRYRHEF